jgi:hypothetical protein
MLLTRTFDLRRCEAVYSTSLKRPSETCRCTISSLSTHDDKKFRSLLRQVLALPLLPKGAARETWIGRLKPELLAYCENSEDIKAYCAYFDRQWMGLREELWSFYRAQVRTTNAAEAYHSFLKR